MTFTSPFTAVTGAVITAAGWNTSGRDNINHLRGLVPDAGAADYWLVSTSTTAAAWVARNTAVLAGIGYTPLRNTTDTLTGNLTVTGTLQALGVVVGNDGVSIGTGGVLASGPASFTSYAGGSTTVGTPSFRGVIIGNDGLIVGSGGADINGPITPDSYGGGSTAAGNPSMLGLTVGNNGVLVGTGGVAASGPVSGTTGTFSGAVSGGSYTGGTISTGTPAVQGLNVGTNGIAVSGQIASSVTTGTAPFTVASTTLVSNLNADLLDGLSSASFSRIASGTYTGNGGTTARQITTGWAAKLVLIHDTANDTMYVAVNTTNSIRLGPSPTFVQGSSSVHTHASDGFTVADGTAQGNVNTNTYSYTAFG